MKRTGPLCLNWSPLSKGIFILRRKSSKKKISNLKKDYLGTTHVKARRGGYRILLFIQNDDNKKKIPMEPWMEQGQLKWL